MENKLKQGEALFAEGKIEEAEKCFLEILNEDPKNKEAYNNLGVISFQRQDIEQALEYLTKVLEIDPFHKDAILNYSALLKSTNRFYDSMPILEKAIERFPDDQEISRLLSEVCQTRRPRTKIAVLCLPGLQSFLGDIVDYLKTKYDVRTCYSNNNQEIGSATQWADIVWLEWANQMAIHVTNKIPQIKDKKVICRLHGYEVFTDMPAHINWNVVDSLLFVAKHKQEIFNKKFKIQSPPQTVIRNGINTNKFTIADNKQNTKRLVFIGHLNFRKGVPLLLQFYHELLKVDPDYHLYIRGEFQDPRLEMAARTMIKELSLDKKLEFVNWVEDLNSWLADKSHILSFSLEESFHYTIGNGMAAGLKSVIHAWNESRDIWPNQFIFRDLSEFLQVMMDDAYHPEEYRDWVKEHRNSCLQLEKIAQILSRLGESDLGLTLQDPLSAGQDHEFPETNPVDPQICLMDTNDKRDITSDNIRNYYDGKYLKKQEQTKVIQENPEAMSIVQFEERQYNRQNDLNLLLLSGETPQDYMNLLWALQNKPNYSEKFLIQRFQSAFHTILGSYFNSLQIPEYDKNIILRVCQLINTDETARIQGSRGNNEEFLVKAFQWLKIHLPQGEDSHSVKTANNMDTLHSLNPSSIVLGLYNTLQHGFKPLLESGYLSSFIVHGSMATMDYTLFSDVDTQLFLSDAVFCTPKVLCQVAQYIASQNIHLKLFDPIQHHGYFISTNLDCKYYPQAFLPLGTIELGLCVLGQNTLEFHLRTSNYENQFALWQMGYYFRETIVMDQYPEKPFEIKRFLSRFMMLPVLYLELFHEQYPYKRDSFEMVMQHLPEGMGMFMDQVSLIRQKWNSKLGIRFNHEFVMQVYNYSEYMLKQLEGLKHE